MRRMSTVQIASTLFQLQQLDLELDRLTAEKQSVVQALQGNTTLQKARTAYTVSQQQLHAGEQAQKEAEWSLEDVSRRLSTQEQRLYSGTGVNSKDLNSLQQEVQRLRAQHHRQEEAVLEDMDTTEALQEAMQRKLRELQKVEEDWQKESVALVSRREQLEVRQQETQAKRTQLAATIAADVLHRYDAMRRTKQGRAISKVEQGSCQWCRVILTPSELQRVRLSGDLQTCTNCGRILYYER
ncbi:MAG: C4-type zinc ribbon domain-containing protein [Ktedonobacteraceae bacterium]